MASSSIRVEGDYGIERSPAWEALPSDIVREVYKLVQADEFDKNAFVHLVLSSVCSSWRASLSPLPPLDMTKFPLRVPPPSLELAPFIRANQTNTAIIAESRLLLFAPPQDQELGQNTGWIVKVEQRSDKNSWVIENPLGVSRGSFKAPESFRGSVDMFENYTRVKQVARPYVLQYVTGQQRRPVFCKVVIIWKKGGLDDFTALALIENRNLGLWRPGQVGWTVVGGDQSGSYSDIIAFNGKFYAVTRDAKLLTIDPVTKEENWLSTTRLPSANGSFLSSRLVESNGRLYLVFREMRPLMGRDFMTYRRALVEASASNQCITSGFFMQELHERMIGRFQDDRIMVFVLDDDLETNFNPIIRWRPVDSLDDRVFFAGKYLSFSLAAEELGWLRGSCVLTPIITNERSEIEFSVVEDSDEDGVNNGLSVSDLHFKNCLSVFTLEDMNVAACGSSRARQYTSIFWPPPAWFSQLFSG